MTTPLALVSVLAVMTVWPSNGGGGADPCGGAIPTGVRLAIKKALPGYRPARGTDPHLATDEKGPQKCMAVARGDFNGDGHDDYGVLLVADTSKAMLGVALRVGQDWQIQSLRSFQERELVNLYVTVAAPGTYGSNEGTSEPLEPGEARSFQSKHVGIVTGTFEASAIGYFWTPQGWTHVWIAD